MHQRNGIIFLPAWVDACALWRLYMPHLNFPGSSFFAFAKKPNFDVIAGREIMVVQRCCTQPQYDFMKLCRQLGLRIVYDLDDNLFDIPEYNPAYEKLCAAKEGFRACMQMTDAITVSTKRLAKDVKEHVGMVWKAIGREVPIFVCENRIDERLFSEPRVDAQRIVGWAGSSSHVGDLPLITPAIDKLAKQYYDVVFEFRGSDPPQCMVPLPNFRWRPWVPVPEYPARMPQWGWHIALAPVTDHPFNDAKSSIKMIEAGYCGIPCLASWVRPYEEFVSHDPELRWLLCAGPSNFENKLRTLLEEPERCWELGARMQKVVEAHYSFRQGHEQWQDVWDYVRGLKQ